MASPFGPLYLFFVRARLTDLFRYNLLQPGGGIPETRIPPVNNAKQPPFNQPRDAELVRNAVQDGLSPFSRKVGGACFGNCCGDMSFHFNATSGAIIQDITSPESVRQGSQERAARTPAASND